jgi:hypothetical protein
MAGTETREVTSDPAEGTRCCADVTSSKDQREAEHPYRMTRARVQTRLWKVMPGGAADSAESLEVPPRPETVSGRSDAVPEPHISTQTRALFTATKK